MLNLAELKKQNPSLAAMSDMDIVMQVSKGTGISPSRIAARMGLDTEAFYHDPERNPLSAGLASGVDQFQGLMGSAGAAAADAFGWDSGRDAMNRYAKDQMIESQFSGRPDLERVEDQSLGSALPFLGYQVSKQVPNIAAAMAAMLSPIPGDEAAVLGTLGRGLASAPKALGGGGLEAGASFAGRRAALEAGQGLAKDVYRSTAAMYPLGVGSLYQESVDAGDPSPYAALAGGVPYGMAESVLPAWLKGTLGTAGEKFAGNLLQRMGKAGALAATGEAGVELFQNELEMGFNPTLTDEDIASRRLNSAVIGGLVGGSLGSLGGLRSSAPVDLLARPDEPAPGYNISQNIFTPDTSVQDIINQNVGLTAGAGHSRKDVSSAFNAPLSAPIWAADFDGNPILLRTEGDLYNFEHFGPSGIRSHIESAVDRDRAQFTDLANQNQARIDAMYAEPPSGSVRFHQAAGLTASRPPAPIPQSIHADAINAGVPISGYEQVESYDADILSSSDASRLGIPQTGGRAPLSTPMVTTGNIMGGRAPNIAAGIAAMQEGTNETTEMAAPSSQVQGVDPTGSGAGGAAGGVGQRAEGSDGTAGAQPGAGTVVPVGDALPASAALTKYAITSTAKSVKSLAASMDEHLRSGTISDAEFDGLMLRLSQAQFVPKQREALAKEFSRLVIERMTGKPNTIAAPAPVRLQDEQKQPGDVVTWTAQQIAENNLALSGQQQTAMGVLNDAAKTGDLDQFIDAEGAFILPALAKATGISPGALKVQLTRVKEKIEKSTGTSMVEALRQRERDMRVVQAPDTDLAGLSPSEQRIVVDEAEIFGTEDGGEQSMGIIDSVGGSQSETGAGAAVHAANSMIADARDALATARQQANKLRRGSEQRVAADRAVELAAEKLAVLERRDAENKQKLTAAVSALPGKIGDTAAMAAAEPNPVADARAAAAMAKFEREQEARQRFVLQQPIAAEAAKMWDKWRLDMADPASVPVAADLREQYAYEWVLAYQEWSDGSIDDGQIESDQQNIAELNQATAPEPRAALAAPTAGGITEGPRSDGQTGQRLGSENGRQDQAPARLEAPVVTERPSESDRQPVESAPTEAVDPDADLMDALQRIAAKKDGKNSKIATSYIREAMLAQTEEEGAEVRRRAGEWANAVLGEEPGVGKFSVDGEVGPHEYRGKSDAARLKHYAKLMLDGKKPVTWIQVGDDRALELDRLVASGKLVKIELPPLPYLGDTDMYYRAGDEKARARFMAAFYDWERDGETGQVSLDMGKALGYSDADLAAWKQANANNPNMQFSKAEATTGQPATTLREKLLKAFAAPYFFDRRVVVVQSQSELPPDVAQSAKGKKVLGFFENKTQKVYLIADNIAEGTELSVLLHEVGVHAGMRNLLGAANYDALVGQLKRWLEVGGDTVEGRLAIKAYMRMKKAEGHTPGQAMNARQSEELLAYFVEEAVKAGIDPTAVSTQPESLRAWFRRLWAAVKVAIRKLNLNPDSLTAQSVVDLAFGAAQMELKNDKGIAGRGKRRSVGATEQGAGRGDPAEDVLRYYEAGAASGPSAALLETDAPGTEYHQWAGNYGPYKDVITVGFTFAGGEFATVLTTNALLNQAVNNNSSAVADIIEQAALQVAVAKPVAGRDNVYEFSMYGPRPGGAAYAAAKASGGVTDLAVKVADSRTVRNTRLEGVPVGDTLRLQKEVRRRVTRAQDGRVPNIVTVRTSGAHIGKRAYYPSDVVQRKFSIADDETIKATVAKLPTSMQKPALRISRTIKDVLKRGLYGSMFGHDLVDAMTVHLKSARGYFDLLSEKEVTKQTYEAQIEDIMIRAYQVKDKDALNVFLKSSTRRGLWGFKPEWDKTAQVDAKQKIQFDALSPEAQQVAKDMFRRGAEYRNELRKVITDAMTSEFAAMDEAAVSPAEKKKIEQRKLKQMRLFDKSFGTILGPYVPLSRFGGFVMVAKSARMRAAEEARDAKLIEELESDPSHRVVMFADSMGEAMELRDEMVTRGFTADAFEKEYYHQQMSEAPWSAISRLKTMVMQEFGDGKDNRAVRAINTMLSDLYLSTVAEASARRHEMRRRNIEGASDDMLKSFASKGVADAHFIAALKNNGKLNKVLADMRGESAAAENKSEARRALNEILRRHALGLEFRPTPFQDKAMALTSFWMLLTNPRYYVMNALQTAMISVPYMAGKFGYARTWAETNKAYKELAVGFGGAKGFAHGEYDIDALRIPDADKQFLHALKNAGKLDIGISMDLGAWSADDSAASKAINRMAHHTRTMARQVEVVNRVSAGLAAYRLAVQNGMSDPKRYAFDVINRTHGDYTRMAAPRFLNMAPKVMTQFMKYKLIQWSLLARVGHDMLKGASKEERAAAAKSFTFMMSHSAVMTGAMATPPAYIVMLLANAMAGSDDDDPRSMEERAREYIGDDTMADLLLRGAPAAAGVDVSKYVGWEGVVNPTPFLAQDPMTRRGYADSMVGLSGPFLGGLLPRALDGINLMAGGDYWKGLEKMLPSLPSNVLKAMREANDGVTLKNGDVVLQPEEIDFFDGMLQVLGVPPSTTASAQRDMRWAKDREQFFEDRVRELRNKYAQAYRDGDNGDMQDIREQWLNMQAAQRRLGIKPSSLSSLLKSPRAQEKREEDLAEQMSAI